MASMHLGLYIFKKKNKTVKRYKSSEKSSSVLQSDAVVYAGAGFDAGECAARIPAVATSDAGRWSCHVGLMGAAPEQRLNIELTVHGKRAVLFDG